MKVIRASLVADSKESACNAGDLGLIPGLGSPLKFEMATHSSILGWRIPWTGEPPGLQSMELQRIRHDWATSNTHVIKKYAYLCLVSCMSTKHRFMGSKLESLAAFRFLSVIFVSSKATKSKGSTIHISKDPFIFLSVVDLPPAIPSDKCSSLSVVTVIQWGPLNGGCQETILALQILHSAFCHPSFS